MILSGEIFEVINRIATREGVTITLMGRRGRGIIDTLLLGSVASDLLRYGKTDLLLVNNRRAKVPGQISPARTFFPMFLSVRVFQIRR